MEGSFSFKNHDFWSRHPLRCSGPSRIGECLHVSSIGRIRSQAENDIRVPFGGPGVDDSVALNQTIANCTTDSTIVFTANTTYNIS